MNRKKALHLLSGFAVLASPFAVTVAPFATSPVLLASASAQTVESTSHVNALPAVLQEAAKAFAENEEFSPAILQSLKQNKEIILPHIQAGIRLEPGRLPLKSGWGGNNVYWEWRFWIELATKAGETRALPELLAWLGESRPIIDPFLLESALSGLLPIGQEQKLLAYMDQADGNTVLILLNVLAERKALSDNQLEQWKRTYADQPQISGIVSFVANQPDGTKRLREWYDENQTSSALNREIIERMDIRQEQDRVWLTKVAQTTKDPWVEQSIDMRLVYQKGDLAAAQRLHDSGVKHGFHFPMNGTVEKFLLARYPDGMLAKGVKRYEEIAGKPYFFGGEQEPWYDSYGADYAQPEAAITKWQAFLEEYPLHPAADDAAYRLARCYQMAGQFEQALYWFEQATLRGDRDLGYDASGQFLYVLDVEMTGADLAKLNLEKRPQWQQIWIRYSMALSSLRENNYKQAAKQFRELLKRHDGQQLFTNSILNSRIWYNGIAEFSFWDQVKVQLAQTEKRQQLQEEIGRLQGAAKAKKQYELAASLYHDEMAYYNYLWRGERQSFFWLGQIRDMEYSESLARYIGRFNHLVQAAAVFSTIQLDEADAETGAKTLFSLALCNSKLMEYGDEIRFYATKASLLEQLKQAGEALLKRYPDSDLADDTLLLLYHYSENPEYLNRLTQQYPKGDKKGEAEMLLAELKQEAANPNPYRFDRTLTRPPYQVLAEGDWRMPQKVKDWAKGKRGTAYHGMMQEGEWTYLYVAAPPGKAVDFGSVETASQGSHVYFYLTDKILENQHRRAWSGALVRMPKHFLHEKTVVFEEIK